MSEKGRSCLQAVRPRSGVSSSLCRKELAKRANSCLLLRHIFFKRYSTENFADHTKLDLLRCSLECSGNLFYSWHYESIYSLQTEHIW